MHFLTRRGVDEGDSLRLEVKTVSLRAIELITFDRAA